MLSTISASLSASSLFTGGAYVALTAPNGIPSTPTTTGTVINQLPALSFDSFDSNALLNALVKTIGGEIGAGLEGAAPVPSIVGNVDAYTPIDNEHGLANRAIPEYVTPEQLVQDVWPGPVKVGTVKAKSGFAQKLVGKLGLKGSNGKSRGQAVSPVERQSANDPSAIPAIEVKTIASGHIAGCSSSGCIAESASFTLSLPLIKSGSAITCAYAGIVDAVSTSVDQDGDKVTGATTSTSSTNSSLVYNTSPVGPINRTQVPHIDACDALKQRHRDDAYARLEGRDINPRVPASEGHDEVPYFQYRNLLKTNKKRVVKAVAVAAVTPPVFPLWNPYSPSSASDNDARADSLAEETISQYVEADNLSLEDLVPELDDLVAYFSPALPAPHHLEPSSADVFVEDNIESRTDKAVVLVEDLVSALDELVVEPFLPLRTPPSPPASDSAGSSSLTTPPSTPDVELKFFPSLSTIDVDENEVEEREQERFFSDDAELALDELDELMESMLSEMEQEQEER